MPLYGGPPKECPFCGADVKLVDVLSASISHRFQCNHDSEHHGYYSNNKNEAEPFIAEERLNNEEMRMLIYYALLNPILPRELREKVRKWKR